MQFKTPLNVSVTIDRTDTTLTLEWSHGPILEFTLTPEHATIAGIRSVSHGSVALRSSNRHWRPVIETPEGIAYRAFRLRSVDATHTGGVRVVADAVGYPTGLMEEHDEYHGDMFDVESPQGEVIDELTWEFEPTAIDFDSTKFTGFKFRYHFKSDAGRTVYRIFDHCTWEVGGSLAGNELLLQGQCNPPVGKLTRDDYFTTACNFYGAAMGAVMAPPKYVSFQRLPRIGTLQAFDFIAHDSGVLLGLFEPVEEVFTLVQTQVGEDWLNVLDEHRVERGSDVTTVWKHMLFSPVSLKREAQRNLWANVYEVVHADVRARYGILPSPVLPRIWIPQYGGPTTTIDGVAYPRERVMYELADRMIPRWKEMGVKEICTHSLWTSDYVVDGEKKKSDNGWHGGLHVGSICDVRVHEIDPFWGGPEALKYFCDKAHAAGMTVQLWFATHLGSRAPIYKEHPEYRCMARYGHANTGGFGTHSLVTMDLNNEDAFNWLYGKLKAVRDQTGADGFFHDSYGNMTFLPTNFKNPSRKGQQNAYGKLVAKLQNEAGYKTLTAEGIGPMATGHFSIGLISENGGKYYALDWWLGEEDMIYRLNMGVGVRPWAKAPGKPDPEEFGFRCLAFGGRFGFTDYKDHMESWDGWVRDQNRIYGQIDLTGARREILPDGVGVLWHTKNGKVLFTLKPHRATLAGAEHLTPDGPVAVKTTNGVFDAPAWQVYRGK